MGGGVAELLAASAFFAAGAGMSFAIMRVRERRARQISIATCRIFEGLWSRAVEAQLLAEAKLDAAHARRVRAGKMAHDAATGELAARRAAVIAELAQVASRRAQ